MNKEEVKEVGKLQMEIMILKVLKSIQPLAYTGHDIDFMVRDIKRNDRLMDAMKRFNELTKGFTKIKAQEISEKYKDDKFNMEDQKLLCKDIINQSITFEEFMDKYCG